MLRPTTLVEVCSGILVPIRLLREEGFSVILPRIPAGQEGCLGTRTLVQQEVACLDQLQPPSSQQITLARQVAVSSAAQPAQISLEVRNLQWDKVCSAQQPIIRCLELLCSRNNSNKFNRRPSLGLRPAIHSLAVETRIPLVSRVLRLTTAC